MANKQKDNSGSRRKPALALLIVLLLAVLIFLFSDAAFIKSARDALMSRLGYVSEETAELDDGDELPDSDASEAASEELSSDYAGAIDVNNLPKFDGNHYVEINGNVPAFPEEVYAKAGLVKEGDKWKTKGNLLGTVDSNKLTAYEFYNPLDKHGRCRAAYGCLGRETMPEEGAERGAISEMGALPSDSLVAFGRKCQRRQPHHRYALLELRRHEASRRRDCALYLEHRQSRSVYVRAYLQRQGTHSQGRTHGGAICRG